MNLLKKRLIHSNIFTVFLDFKFEFRFEMKNPDIQRKLTSSSH